MKKSIVLLFFCLLVSLGLQIPSLSAQSHSCFGSHEVKGAILSKYVQLGACNSFLGSPETSELATPDGQGRFNHFQGGSIYWHPSTGAHEIHGDIREKWASLGYERSFLGYPIADEIARNDGVRYSKFQNGSIYWTRAEGAYLKDGCTFYSGENWTGDSVRYEMPDRPLGESWGSYSRRFTGENLRLPGGRAIYDNLESVRIDSKGTGITLYVYTGENFDGTFQAIHVEQSDVPYKWNFGSMSNRVRSVICQRDERLNRGAGLVNLLAGFENNHLIPTSIIADNLTASVHDAVNSQRHRFYNHRIDIKHGRIFWSTGHELCREISCTPEPKEWKRKYRDYLQYQYKSRGRLKADGANYDITVNFWIEPMLIDGILVFKERAWKVNVSNHIWHKRIKDNVAAAVKNQYDSLGDRLTLSVRRLVRDNLGEDGVLEDNQQLIISHSCISIFERVGYPGHNYTQEQVENICSGTTPEVVAAPGIRLLKRNDDE